MRNEGSFCGVTDLSVAIFGARGDRSGKNRSVGDDALDAARLLHLLVFGEKLQRHRVRAADELVQENAELAAGAVDQIATRRHLGRRQLLESRQLALDLFGVGGDRVEAHHLQRARRLVHVGARTA